MPQRSCSVANCTRPHYARGLCGMHYKRVRRHGDAQPDVAPRDERAPRYCAVEPCGHVIEARGWCHGHYLRWVRTGDVQPDVPLTRRTQPEFCTVESCGRRCHAQGLCRTHHKRLTDEGSVRADVPIREVSGDGCISHGYRKVPVPPADRWLVGGQTYVLHHRIVMARLLGRPLYADEVVHHINGERLDNRPQNLELWSTMQPKGQRVVDKVEFAIEVLRRYASDGSQVTSGDPEVTLE